MLLLIAICSASADLMSITFNGIVKSSNVSTIHTNSLVDNYTFDFDPERNGNRLSNGLLLELPEEITVGNSLTLNFFHAVFTGDLLLKDYVVAEVPLIKYISGEISTYKTDFAPTKVVTLLRTDFGNVFTDVDVANWVIGTQFNGIEKVKVNDKTEYLVTFALNITDIHPVPESTATCLMGCSLLFASTLLIFKKRESFLDYLFG
jgi:hypothetical protein